MDRLQMRKKIIFIFLLITVPAMVNSASLLEVYQQALQSDPSIREAESRRQAALEGNPQARSVFLPQLAAGARYTKSDFDGSSVEGDAAGNIAEVTSQSSSSSIGWQFQLTQTILRWDHLIGLKQAIKKSAKAQIDYEITQQDLIIRVAKNYFNVLAAEDNLNSIHTNRLAIARQLEQAKQKFEVGSIAITDVQESQAAYDQSVANEIGAKRSLATTRELLREITGEYVLALTAPDNDFPLSLPDPENESSWIDMAMQQNLSLISGRLEEEIARNEITYRRTGHYPTLDLVANIGGSDADTANQIRNGIAFPDLDTQNRNDSVYIQFSLPIFSGGYTSSKVREAVYLHRATRDKLQRLVRETERQTRDAYLGITSEISRVKAFEQAVLSSKTALEATQVGFEVGTRTIVDVLNSQFALDAAITNHYKSRYDYIVNIFLLKQAAGMLRVQDLEEVDKWLKERQSPEEIFSTENIQ